MSRRFSFSTLWQVPKSNWNSALARTFLEGWQVSNITILQKGTPLTVFCGGCDYNADGAFGERPNIVSGVPSRGFTKNQMLNSRVFNCPITLVDSECVALFPTPSPGTVGNLGRNTFVGPGYINTDFSAAKKTRIPWFVGTEGAQMEFRAEFFNVFNHVNLTGVTSDVGQFTCGPDQQGNPQCGGPFGLANGVFPARDIQFGLRIEF
ncbi:MAG: hypothetical protein DMG21_06955 [Acidobacteria bacterium]|nr:MAG: hypothetical protein DMG21_06955 [Acidobacteriota bacterium]